MPLSLTLALSVTTRSGAMNALRSVVSGSAVTSSASSCSAPGFNLPVKSSSPPGYHSSPQATPSTKARACVCNIVKSSTSRRPAHACGTVRRRLYHACWKVLATTCSSSQGASQTCCAPSAAAPASSGQMPGTLNQPQQSPTAGTRSAASCASTGRNPHKPLRQIFSRVGVVWRHASSIRHGLGSTPSGSGASALTMVRRRATVSEMFRNSTVPEVPRLQGARLNNTAPSGTGYTRSQSCQPVVPTIPKTSGQAPTRSPFALWNDIVNRPVCQLSCPTATPVTFICVLSLSWPYSGFSRRLRFTIAPVPSSTSRLPAASFSMCAPLPRGQPSGQPRASSLEKSPLLISGIACGAADASSVSATTAPIIQRIFCIQCSLSIRIRPLTHTQDSDTGLPHNAVVRRILSESRKSRRQAVPDKSRLAGRRMYARTLLCSGGL